MEKDKVQTYTVIFDHAEEGGYVVSVPSLPGCISQGDTFEEARNNIKDAIIAYLDVLKEDGDEIPTESPEHIAATIAVPL